MKGNRALVIINNKNKVSRLSYIIIVTIIALILYVIVECVAIQLFFMRDNDFLSCRCVWGVCFSFLIYIESMIITINTVL